MNDQELEVKFLLGDLPGLESRLQALGAHVEAPRVHEVNLRFDTPDGHLKSSMQVLRLRQDAQVRLTYKGPGEERGGVRVRQEIEFSVGDFAAARAFLEALGYRVTFMYEKYRTTYGLRGLHVTLDEMPYGRFAEIEGPDPASIRRAAGELGLDWEARILESYTTIFDQVRSALGVDFTDLSFANFEVLNSPLEKVGLRPADRR
jgi:adenylate cyclase class 2